MNQAELRAPWEFSKSVLSLAPVAGNTAQNHASVDRTGYASAVVDVAFSVSGTPTGGTLTLKLQDSGDGVNFADYGSPVSAPISAANAAGGVASLPVHLGGARQFVRAVSTGVPTGGTSPAVTAAAVLRLFGPDRLPAL